MPHLSRKVTGLLIALLVAGFLVAGLWPFSFYPPNHVGWLMDRPGLSFQRNSVAFQAEPSEWSAGASPDQPAAFTAELWLEPDWNPSTDVFNILTLDDGPALSGIVLCQWQTALLLRVRERGTGRGFREAGENHLLSEQTPRLITICSDSSGTTFSLNGSAAKRFPGFTLPASFLKGRLILGDAATGKHPWSGKLFGLALFGRALDASEVARHHVLWTNHQAASLASESGLTALYLFEEGGGSQANDRSANSRHLLIPDHYQTVQKRALQTPWEADDLDVSNWDDLIRNLLGFVPFGFILLKHRRLAKPAGGFRDVAWATAIGAAISLAIEITQIWLPTRHSSAADLFCNTLGALLGALLAARFKSGADSPKPAP